MVGACFDETEMNHTKYVVDKVSGKFNLEDRYAKPTNPELFKANEVSVGFKSHEFKLSDLNKFKSSPLNKFKELNRLEYKLMDSTTNRMRKKSDKTPTSITTSNFVGKT